ncbi:MAG: hypothetical protein L7H18_00690 [Candidatus Nealsonbacteria bacterium DGGOD1a]|jgi:hypothetical protein|nr:MAG: hypothetical protein L7H18_00690 [Candidatus Nealsonbacteria bacterium DGGOD1a]
MNLLGFYPDKESDFKFTVFLFAIAAMVSIFVLIKTKDRIKAGKTFSVLGNLALLPAGCAGTLSIFGMWWLGLFAVYIWPIINIMLFVKRKILALFLCSTALNVFFAYVFFDNPPYRLGLFSGILWPATNILLLAYILIKRKRKGG